MLSCFLSYANQYTKPFNEISGVITELQNALACADRLLEFLDSEEMSADPELLPEHSETAKGQVTFDNVCFSYTKDRPLIRNFSLGCTGRLPRRHCRPDGLRQNDDDQSSHALLRPGQRQHQRGRHEYADDPAPRTAP